MDTNYFEALSKAKQDNYKIIYKSDAVSKKLTSVINPMFEKMYETLLLQIKSGNKNTVIYKHHIEFLNNLNRFNKMYNYYEETEQNQIVVDFIASMTDDYFIELYDYLFPREKSIEYISYFNDLEG